MEKQELQFLPLSVNITNKKILIIGGGKVGFHKASVLLSFTQNVSIISPVFDSRFKDLPFELIKREYKSTDLNGIFLVYICTNNKELNKSIKADAERQKVLATVCDAPELCDFISSAIHKKDNVTIAISSNAQNVHQSVDIRNQIRKLEQEGEIQIHRKKYKNK